MDGIHVLRVALYPSHDASGLHRALNYASFALSAAVLGGMLVRQPDVLYVYHPPATIALAAMVIGALRDVPFVYDVQDLWPDTLEATGMLSNKRLLAIVRRWCDVVYRRAAHIVVLSPGMRRKVIERGVPSSKVHVIYNWCDEASISPPDVPREAKLSERFTVLFAGTMGRAQDLPSVLCAAAVCQTIAPSVEFVLLGGGVERGNLISFASQMGLHNVRFLGRQPMHAMGPILAAADALLVHLKDDPLFRITIPSKTQAYLAAGKPIVMAVRGDAADLIMASHAGITCQPGDPRSIANAVKELAEAGDARLASMGRNGRAFYDRELSTSTGVDKFERILAASASGSEIAEQDRPWTSLRTAPVEEARAVTFYQRFGKRAFDLIGASLALIMFSPVLAIVALLIRIELGSPVIFRQVRPGLDERLFAVIKFRTMKDARNSFGQLLSDAERLTALGRFLRKASFDELPQLLNVLRGNMSLVGPRPLLEQYLPLYDKEQKLRHRVRPGITGWAQVNGRNALAWKDRFTCDVWYVRHASFAVDLRILWKTVHKVFSADGISSEGHATMPIFKGGKSV
jgi:lipopolysaccharide/colanic/teichoic acid biosynthesis glycosyltransferase/glycosyltransferase involved in cell wall biosynthesis